MNWIQCLLHALSGFQVAGLPSFVVLFRLRLLANFGK